MLPVSDFSANKINLKKSEPYLVGKVKVKILILSALFIMMSLFFTQLVFANNLALNGEKLSQVETEISKLEAENRTLKVEIAQISSLGSLEKKAKDLGFNKPSKVVTF